LDASKTAVDKIMKELGLNAEENIDYTCKLINYLYFQSLLWQR